MVTLEKKPIRWIGKTSIKNGNEKQVKGVGGKGDWDGRNTKRCG